MTCKSEKEEWRPVLGYEGLYEVSSLGRVRSLDRRREVSDTCKTPCFYPSRIKKFVYRKDGRVYVTLCKNGRKHPYGVHRLVAQAFLPNPNNYPEVNHINETPSDNRLVNLEWCSIEYNRNYGTRAQRIAYALSRSCIAIYPDGATVWFSGIHEASKITGINYRNIHAVCQGKRQHAGGIAWKFADEEYNNFPQSEDKSGGQDE